MTVSQGTWRLGRGGIVAQNASAVLTCIVVVVVLGLTAATIADAPRWVSLLGQGLLVITFAALTGVDFRAAVAVAMVELAVGASSGQWTVFPGGVHGRLVLDGILVIGALVLIAKRWRGTGALNLGRYGAHALGLAIVIPIVWMTLGLINGNNPNDVFADGNGHIFFAFALVFVVLIARGQGAWVRRWLFIACAMNALVLGILVALSVTNVVPLEPTLRVLLGDKLLMGNAIGYTANGAYRLFLSSGLYLQVGLALITWRLLADPRRVAMWVLLLITSVGIVATYTRGFWVGSILAAGVVLILGTSRVRQALVVVGSGAALAAVITVMGLSIGFSLPDYVLERAATVTAIGTPGPDSSGPPSSSPDASGRVPPQPAVVPGIDTGGLVSNEVRVEQARVLAAHISERPIFGWGFGTSAPDYRYGSIFSYELGFLDLLYKTGILGSLLFLSFPVRVIADALRSRIGRAQIPSGVDRRETAVVVAIVASILLSGATNPFFLAAFGLMPILAMTAWLDPGLTTER